MAKDLNGKELPKGIRQRKDGRYEGRFTYEGECYTLYGTDVKKLHKQLLDKRYEVEHGLYMKQTNITVDSWFHTWMEEYKRNSVKYGTYKLYQDEYSNYIRDVFGKKKLTEIRSEHIQRLFNQMVKKYSPKTIHLVKIVLNGMYKQAVRNGLVQRNPVENTVLPKNKTRKKIRVLTVEEQKLFLEYARESRYYALYVMALSTGMRNGELRALKWEDIDFDNQLVHVNGTLKYKAKTEEKYWIDTPKSEASQREIPLIENTCLILKQHRKKQMEQKLRLGSMWRPQKGFENMVFTGPFGRCVTEEAVCKDLHIIEEELQKAGYSFEHITPHTLRHTFATRGLENGIPAKVMQELLGHTSITMTMDIYSHVLPDVKTSEIQKIANIF